MTSPTLDTDIAKVLKKIAKFNPPPMAEVPVDQLRQGIRTVSDRVRSTDIYSVEDIEIPAHEGGQYIPARVYRPSGQSNLPALVFYHGGGWVLCDVETHDEVVRRIALAANCVVISVDYRLAPEHKYPAGADDAYQALCWVFDNTSSLNIDADRIGIAGDSAGGNLAAVTCLRARDEAGPKIFMQSLWYPVTNIHTLETESYKVMSEGYNLKREDMAWLKSQYLESPELAALPTVSPLLSGDLSGLPPTYVMTANFDVLRDDGQLYAEALEAAGNRVSYECFPSLVHGFLNISHAVPAAEDALQAVAQHLHQEFWGG
jgi:acetyl esterase/lipase